MNYLFLSGNVRFDNMQLTGAPLTIIEEEFCEGDEFVYEGIAYDEAGQHLILTPEMDCGSHVMLRLSYPAIDTTITILDGIASAMPGADQYQWLDCGKGSIPISGATDLEFMPGSTGIMPYRSPTAIAQ